jgi:hypothetical protein
VSVVIFLGLWKIGFGFTNGLLPSRRFSNCKPMFTKAATDW